MAKHKSKGIYLLATFGILAGIVGVGLGVIAAVRANSKTVSYVDDTKLFIGVPYMQNEEPVTLTITAKGSNGVKTATLSSADLPKLSGQDEKARFYDYASDPVVDTKGQSIGYWLADGNNTITVSTIWSNVIESADVSITKAGIWFIDVAKEAGQRPNVKYAAYYSEKIVYGGINE